MIGKSKLNIEVSDVSPSSESEDEKACMENGVSTKTTKCVREKIENKKDVGCEDKSLWLWN